MKNIHILFILVILIAGCHTTKKAGKMIVDTDKVTQIRQENKEVKEINEVKDLKVETATQGVTIEYYHPAGKTDSLSQDPDNGKGAIKSVTTWTTSTKSEDKGSKDLKEVKDSKGDEKVVEKGIVKTEEKEKPAPDPYRWMWIFLILALIAGGIIYLKRSPILKSIKSVLSLAGKNQKI